MNIENAAPSERRIRLGWSEPLRRIFARFGALPFLLVFMVIFFTLENARFASGQNIVNMTQQGVYLLLVALAQMLVLISGGFDLSIGANIALTSICSAMAMSSIYAGNSAEPGIAIAGGVGIALLVGLGVGLVNGIGVSVLNVNPFIVTLATASAYQGITLLLSQGQEIGGLPPGFVTSVGSGTLGAGVPVTLAILVPVVAALAVVVSWSRYGRYLYAIGSNPAAARVAGVRVKLNVLMTYVLCSVLAALSGLLLTARVSNGEPLLGGEYTLQSITAAVIGGASLRGGEGGIGGTVLGTAFVVMLANGMDLMRLSSNHEMIVLGLVLIFAVVADRQRARALEAGRRAQARTAA